MSDRSSLLRLLREMRAGINTTEAIVSLYDALITEVDKQYTIALTAERKLAELRERTRWHKYPDDKPPSDEVLEAITDAGTILVLGFEEYWFLADDDFADEIQRNVIYWRYWNEPPSDAREDYLEGLSNCLLPDPPEETKNESDSQKPTK